MKGIEETHRRIAKELANRLDKIKQARIINGLDKMKLGQFASDARLTKAIINDEICRMHWSEIERRLVQLPREDKK